MRYHVITQLFAFSLLGSVSARAISKSSAIPQVDQDYDSTLIPPSAVTVDGAVSRAYSGLQGRSAIWERHFTHGDISVDWDIKRDDGVVEDYDSNASQGSRSVDTSSRPGPNSDKESDSLNSNEARGPVYSSRSLKPLVNLGPLSNSVKKVFPRAVRLFQEGGKYSPGRDHTILYAAAYRQTKAYGEANGLMHFGNYKYHIEDDFPQYKGLLEKKYPVLLSAAIGRTASGDVKFMAPADGVKDIHRSIFIEVEWKELVENGQATSVTWIDPVDTSSKLVIWKASQGPIKFEYNKPMIEMANEAARWP